MAGKMRHLIKGVRCFLFGHAFYPVMWLSERAQKIRCRDCDRAYAINHEMQAIIPWDDECEQFYKEWGTLG